MAFSRYFLILLLLAGGDAFAKDPVFLLDFDGHDLSSVASSNVNYEAGVSGRAMSVGSDGFLQYSLGGCRLSADQGTVSVWFRQDFSPRAGTLYQARDIASDGQWLPVPHSSPMLRQILETGYEKGVEILGGCMYRIRSAGVYDEGRWNGLVNAHEWHQLTFTYDAHAGRKVFYFDGEPWYSCSSTNLLVFGQTLQLASGGGRPGLDGAVDEVRIYDVPLTDAEVAASYAEHIPYRIEWLDRSVALGEEKNLRFRVGNLTGRPLQVKLAFSNGQKVPVELCPHAAGNYAVSVKGEVEGVFVLGVNEGRPDYRSFDMVCFRPTLPKECHATAECRDVLLGSFDCTKDLPASVFNFTASEIVTNGTLIYREARNMQSMTGLVMCRFSVKRKGVPHVVEVDYPDDAARTFLFSVHPEQANRLYAGTIDCAGIVTGIDYPLSGRMQTKRLIFWPDSDTVSVGVFGHARDANGIRPPAVSSVRLYESSPLSDANGPVGAAPERRTVGTWDEDPTIDANLAVNNSFNYPYCDLDFYRTKWQRTIDYMRYQGLDTWVIKAVDYGGDATGMCVTLPEAMRGQLCSNGREAGWAELGADMLSRAGMDFWVRINHRSRGYDGWFNRLGGLPAGCRSTFGVARISGVWNPSHDAANDVPNFLMPGIRRSYLRLIAAYRDKFAAYPGFRGITLNEQVPIHFRSIGIGYDDVTVMRFAEDTGIRTPEGDAATRCRFLTEDESRRKIWMDWRCRQVTAFAAEMAQTLRAKGGSAELQIWIEGGDCFQEGVPSGLTWNAERVLREKGVDILSLNAIPGVRVVPCIRPDFHRAWRGATTFRNEAYLPHSDSWRDWMDKGIATVNVTRQSNLEIYPSLGYRAAAFKNWEREFWLPPGANLPWVPEFFCYATPHPPTDHALRSLASLVADSDVQDILHGWWGLMESGEHEAFRRFYSAFRSVPRGRYASVEGGDDPVAVRSGPQGHYLVNRLSCPVEVAYEADGRKMKQTLSGYDLRFVAGIGALGHIRNIRSTVPEKWRTERVAEFDRLQEAVRTVRTHPDPEFQRRLEEFGVGSETFSDLDGIVRMARQALEEGHYGAFQDLFLLGAVRGVLHPELVTGRRPMDWRCQERIAEGMPSEIAALLVQTIGVHPVEKSCRLAGKSLELAVFDAVRKRGTADEFSLLDPGALSEAAFSCEDGVCQWYGFDILKRMPIEWRGAPSVRRAVERGLAGVGDYDVDSEALSLSPRLALAPYRAGRIEVKRAEGMTDLHWRFDYERCTYAVKTPAKRIRWRLMLPYGMNPSKLLVNGKQHDFRPSVPFCIDFDTETESGRAEVEAIYRW